MTHRNILITGGNRGIGLELTKLFIGLGDNVTVICRTKTKELQKLNVRIIDNIDFNKQTFCEESSRELSSLNLKFDVFINNAGIFNNDSLEKLNQNSIKDQMQVNAIAPLVLTSALIPYFNTPSKVVLITSRMGSIKDNHSGGYYGYRMSKSALNAGGKSLALDLKNLNISVGIIHPGYVSTRMTNFNGEITPQESAKNIMVRIESLNLGNSGTFWHANGEELPW